MLNVACGGSPWYGLTVTKFGPVPVPTVTETVTNNPIRPIKVFYGFDYLVADQWPQELHLKGRLVTRIHIPFPMFQP